MTMTSDERRMEERAARWTQLRKLGKPELLAALGRVQRVHGCGPGSPKAELIGAIVDAELPVRRPLAIRRPCNRNSTGTKSNPEKFPERD